MGLGWNDQDFIEQLVTKLYKICHSKELRASLISNCERLLYPKTSSVNGGPNCHL
jgi:hypothetical protein